MPWKETTMMDEKLEFINEWNFGNFSFSELCREFDISTPTGYKYIKRFQEHGFDGLFEQSRRPRGHPRQTPPQIEDRIVDLRKKHPRWGGEKKWKLLHKDFHEREIPCISTVNRIIKRNGLIISRKRRPRVKPVYPIFNPKSCNEVWSADFKGKFKMGNGEYCYPLSIADSYSRFVFTAKGLYGERFEPTQQEYNASFENMVCHSRFTLTMARHSLRFRQSSASRDLLYGFLS